MSSEVDQSPSEILPASSGRSLIQNLRIVSLATVMSRFLGLARDIGMATLFGAGTTLDVFIVAFRLPNLARQLFGEGALTTAFLPVFLRERLLNGDQAARTTLTAVAITLSSFLSLVVLICELLIAWGLTSDSLSHSTRLLLQLLAILLPYTVFICTAALLSAALHALKIFLWPALVPVVLNVIWLTGILAAVSTTPNDPTRAKIVSMAITFAGVMQFLLPLIILHRTEMGFTTVLNNGWSRVREVLVMMFPVIAGVTAMQLNVVLDSLMAWALATPDVGGVAPSMAIGIPALLPSGTATELYIGQRMYQFPLGVFGIALGTVLFPLLAQHAQSGQFSALREDLEKGIRLTVAIALPASGGLFILATPLTELLFRHGEFTSDDSAITARMIAVYGAGVWAYIGLTVLNRAFYATDDRVTPMRFGMIALLINVILNITFVIPLQGIGLALGSVLAAALQLWLTAWKMNRQIGPLDWSAVRTTGFRSVLATATMMVICVLLAEVLPQGGGFELQLMRLVVPFLSGIMTYIITARLLGISELDEILRREPPNV